MTQTRNALDRCLFPSSLRWPDLWAAEQTLFRVECRADGGLAEQESRSGLCLAASSAPRTALSTSDPISVWRTQNKLRTVLWRKLSAVTGGATGRNFHGRRRGGIREDVRREERFTLSIEGCDLGNNVSEGKTSVCKTPSPEGCAMARRRMSVGGTRHQASRPGYGSASLVLDSTGSNWKV